MINSKDSLLNFITQDSHSDYIYDGWANGKIGSISDHTGTNVYRFHKVILDDRGLSTL